MPPKSDLAGRLETHRNVVVDRITVRFALVNYGPVGSKVVVSGMFLSIDGSWNGIGSRAFSQI